MAILKNKFGYTLEFILYKCKIICTWSGVSVHEVDEVERADREHGEHFDSGNGVTIISDDDIGIGTGSRAILAAILGRILPWHNFSAPSLIILARRHDRSLLDQHSR